MQPQMTVKSLNVMYSNFMKTKQFMYKYNVFIHQIGLPKQNFDFISIVTGGSCITILFLLTDVFFVCIMSPQHKETLQKHLLCTKK
jgi:hypothetical protein